MNEQGRTSGPETEPWAVIEHSVPGYFRVTITDDLDGVEVFIGARRSDGGRPVITQVALTGESITSANLRQIPIARLQAALNQPQHLHWIDTALTQGDPLRPLQEAADEGPNFVFARDELRPRLSRPDRTDPAAFYTRVAEAYRQHVTYSSKPAVEIATEAGVPVATARRWINHARELGLLDKGQRGRAI